MMHLRTGVRTSWSFVTAVLAVAMVSLAACAGPRVLHEQVSPQGTIIVEENEQGMRVLYFEKNGARQSVVKPGDPEHLELPYARAVMAGLALHPQPRRILVVGLGGGTLPSFLRVHFPQALIDAAEIDPGVARVAVDYFGFREDANMKIRLGDGRAWIEKAPAASYDLIILDAYGANSVPMSLATVEFLRAVRRALSADGLVISNLWGRLFNPIYDEMVRTYEEVFEELYIVNAPNSGNRIVMALLRRESLTREQLVERSRGVMREHVLRFDLGALVREGFVPATDRDAKARVLRDK